MGVSTCSSRPYQEDLAWPPASAFVHFNDWGCQITHVKQAGEQILEALRHTIQASVRGLGAISRVEDCDFRFFGVFAQNLAHILLSKGFEMVCPTSVDRPFA